jgi:hypothetical protein
VARDGRASHPGCHGRYSREHDVPTRRGVRQSRVPRGTPESVAPRRAGYSARAGRAGGGGWLVCALAQAALSMRRILALPDWTYQRIRKRSVKVCCARWLGTEPWPAVTGSAWRTGRLASRGSVIRSRAPRRTPESVSCDARRGIREESNAGGWRRQSRRWCAAREGGAEACARCFYFLSK